MRNKVGAALAALVSASVVAACGDSGDSDGARTSEATVTIDPAETHFASATELGAALTKKGIRCAVSQGESDGSMYTGSCEVPSPGSTSGVDLSIYVWSSDSYASTQIGASAAQERVHAAVTGRPRCIITGMNWEILVGEYCTAGRQIADTFGGRLKTID